MDLKKDVKYVKGVGPNRVLLLNKIGINTLEDLITYYPRAYQDRSKVQDLIDCEDGEEVLVEVVPINRMVEIRLRGKTMYKLQVRDETARASAIWFNQSYLKNQFKVGEKYKLYGKIKKKGRNNNNNITCI